MMHMNCLILPFVFPFSRRHKRDLYNEAVEGGMTNGEIVLMLMFEPQSFDYPCNRYIDCVAFCRHGLLVVTA